MAAAIKKPVALEYKGYQPTTQAQIQKSQYLADALQSLQASGANIRSPGELAAKLGAAFLLNRGQNKNNEALAAALKGEQTDRVNRILGSLGGGLPGSSPTPSPDQPQAQPISNPSTGLDPIKAASLLGGTQPPPAATPAPQTPPLDALMAGLIKQESGGRAGVLGPQTRYGRAEGMTQMLPATARAMAEKTGVPWKPELMRGATPEAAEYQRTLGQAYLQEGLDKYGGDTQKALMYYHGGPDERLWGPKTRGYAQAILSGLPQAQPQAQMISGPPQGQMQIQQQFPQPGQPQAPMAGQPPQAMPQSQGGMGGQPIGAPSASPAAAPPASAPPPVSPPGAGAWGPNPQEIQIIRDLASDPRTIGLAEQLATELRMKYAAAPEYGSATINGIPARFDKRTGSYELSQVPTGAMSRTVEGSQLGIAGPQGAAYSVDPLGKPTSLGNLPAGMEGRGGSLAPIQQGTQDPNSPLNQLSGEQQLRKEFEANTKDYSEARNGYEKVLRAAQDGTGVSDIALIFGFMKTLDPSSTVREGEFATAQNSGSVADSVKNMYNKALAGERLQPEQRAQFAQTAQQQFGVYQDRYEQTRQRFEDMAGRYGYDPRNIITQYPEVPNAPQSSGRGGGGGGGSAPSGIPQGAQRGQDGQYYIADPSKPGSFPRLQKAPSGQWVIKSASGQWMAVQ